MKTQKLKPPIFQKRPRAFYGSVIQCVGFVLAAAGIFVLSVESQAQAEVAQPAVGDASPVDNSPIGIASREATRRIDTVKAAQDLLTAAEFDRSENRNKEALEKLGTAFQAISNVPAARETREAIFNRYEKAALAYANELIDQARWEDAETVLTNAMNTARDAGKLPAQVDPGIRSLMEKLKGTHYNKSVTPKHIENVTLVERSLHDANALIGAGDFDGARDRYHAVLNIDRYNTAARKGLEKIEQLIMEYERVAYAQARATKMREVAEGWNLQPPPAMAPDAGVEALISAGTGQAALKQKLKRIVIPQVEFQETPMRTVIEFLSQKAEELDVTNADPNQRGLNIVVDPSGGANVDDLPVTIRLSNAPLGDVLHYVTQQVGMKYRIDEFAISIVPLTAPDSNELITWTFEVPPGFLTGDGGGGDAGGAPDPFAAPVPGGAGGTLVKRITAREFLEQRGVDFPPGAVAQMAGNSTMVVRNTPDNVELIDALIQASRETGTKLVMVEFKMISIAETTLKEMGYDWLLGPFNVSGEDVFAAGGTLGNQADGISGQDFPFGGTGGNFVTGGLRSGNTNVTQTIEDIINRDSPTSGISQTAPAILGVAGVFTDPQFEFVWRALNQSKSIDRLCSTSVVTRPGERALIKQVREFIYPTEYDPPEIPNSIGIVTVGAINGAGGNSGVVPVTPATPTAFEMRELGKIIEVEPVISADGRTVNLNLSTDVSDFVGFVNYGSPVTQIQPGSGFNNVGAPIQLTQNRILMPVFDAVKNTTNVSVYDGSTIVIGGLLGEQIDKTEDKVPILGDVPGVGGLFRSTIEEHKKRALVLFATVRILDAAGQPFIDTQFASDTATAQAN